METQFNYLWDLAKTYSTYKSNSQALFSQISNLPKAELSAVLDEYGEKEREFRPVNLIRAEIAQRILVGEVLNDDLISEIKERIRAKDVSYFKVAKNGILSQLPDLQLSQRDVFANWQNPWSILHVFLYRGVVKQTVLQYLDQLAQQISIDLGLSEYHFHAVDFHGPNYFGSDRCWLAFYPITKESHKDSYQLFVNLTENPEAGQVAGHSIEQAASNQLFSISSYHGAVEALKKVKDSVERLNQQSRNYYKIAPGSQASEWQWSQQEKVIAIDFDFPDLMKFGSRQEMNGFRGWAEDSKSNVSWNCWLFKNARKGDVVFATKGVNTCLGVGVIDGAYYYDSGAASYRHRRSVKWLTTQVFQYDPGSLGGYKTLFRPDTFSPTKVYDYILSEYVRLRPELASVFAAAGLKVLPPAENQVNEKMETIAERENEDQKYWWLNANPKIWSINSHKEGQKQYYTTHNEKGNKRRIYKNFQMVKPGDLIIGYETSPTMQIKAIYEVTRPIHVKDGVEMIEFQLMEKLERPIHLRELQEIGELQECEVFQNGQGSLFSLTEAEFDAIQDIIDEKTIIAEKAVTQEQIKRYRYSEDPDKPFLAERKFKEMVELLRKKKNIILQGPPGVGKTFLARKIAYEMMGEIKDTNIDMVQFHQSYSYEDFVQGLRPGKKGGFELKNGVFYNFCQRAHAHPDQNFFFIIDEINRGNLSKVFGELFMLIESDKRDRKFALKLTYGEEDDDKFFVPENLHVIGTMNTADRSLAIVDYALRRRFSFVSLQPYYDAPLREYLSTLGLSGTMIDHVFQTVNSLNKQISADPHLGEGFQIGHSYFCTYNNHVGEKEWWQNILRYDLVPLLEEIWFDDPSKVSEATKKLQLN